MYETVMLDGDDNRGVSMFTSYNLKGLDFKKIKEIDNKIDKIKKNVLNGDIIVDEGTSSLDNTSSAGSTQESKSAFSMSYFRTTSPIVDRNRSKSPMNNQIKDKSDISDGTSGLDKIISAVNATKKLSYYDLSFGQLYSITSVNDSRNNNYDKNDDMNLDSSINDNDGNKIDSKTYSDCNKNIENNSGDNDDNFNDDNSCIDDDHDNHIDSKNSTNDDKNTYYKTDNDGGYNNDNAHIHIHDDSDIDSERSSTDSDNDDENDSNDSCQ
jgi:hypothetical protein